MKAWWDISGKQGFSFLIRWRFYTIFRFEKYKLRLSKLFFSTSKKTVAIIFSTFKCRHFQLRLFILNNFGLSLARANLWKCSIGATLLQSKKAVWASWNSDEIFRCESNAQHFIKEKISIIRFPHSVYSAKHYFSYSIFSFTNTWLN